MTYPRMPLDGATDTGYLLELCRRVERWGSARDWEGYDPYDALRSPLTNVITLGTATGRRLLTQLVRTSPVNLRPALRIRPGRNAMGVAQAASGYLRLQSIGEDTEHQWSDLLRWLLENRVGGGPSRAWGYNFDVQTRFFRYTSDEPNAIATAFACHTLLDAIQEEYDTGGRFRDAVREACELLRGPFCVNEGKVTYFRYVRRDDQLIHNANLLAASVLSRAETLDLGAYRALVDDAISTTLSDQRSDGAWPYSTSVNGRWVDNFHTAYVLESLAACRSNRSDVTAALGRGAAYWRSRMFDETVTPWYFDDRRYPTDSQNFAQGIETALELERHRLPRCDLEFAIALARRSHEMILPDGRVVFRRHRRFTNRVPFVRWTNATLFRALAGLLRRLSDANLDRSF